MCINLVRELNWYLIAFIKGDEGLKIIWVSVDGEKNICSRFA